MNDLDLSDVALLFKSLVVLPTDRLEKKDAPTTKLEISPTTHTQNPKKSTHTPLEKEVQNSTTQEDIISPEAQEKQGVYIKVTPFIILTSAKLKDAYLTPDSAFQKIIQALDIPQCLNYVTTDISVLDTLPNYSCVWCIGLDKSEEAKAKNANHPNLIISPDILSLSNNEEKKQMYLPLKTFITSNMDSISQL